MSVFFNVKKNTWSSIGGLALKGSRPAATQIQTVTNQNPQNWYKHFQNTPKVLQNDWKRILEGFCTSNIINYMKWNMILYRFLTKSYCNFWGSGLDPKSGPKNRVSPTVGGVWGDPKSKFHQKTPFLKRSRLNQFFTKNHFFTYQFCVAAG